MIDQSIREYELHRTEIGSINNCVTQFLGYLFGGSGLIAVSLIVGNSDGKLNPVILGVSLIGFSIIVSSMMTILIYKFISRNRYTGYCLLMSDERWSGKKVDESSLFLWERALTLMRKADMIQFKDGTLRRGNLFGGFSLVTRSLIGLSGTASWAYPNSIIRIFFLASWSFFTIGIYLTSDARDIIPDNVLGSTLDKYGLLLIVSIASFVQLTMWCAISSRFWSVMTGDATVVSFERRLKAHRKTALTQFGIDTSKYPLLSVFTDKFEK